MTKQKDDKSPAGREISFGTPEHHRKTLIAQQRLLERALMRVSLSVDGQDETLDRLLRQLRESLQDPINSDMNAVIDRFDEAEHNIKQNLEENVQAVRQALYEAVHPLQQLNLSPSLSQLIYQFLAQLSQSSKKINSYPALLQQLADIQKQAVHEVKQPGLGLWKKLTGNQQRSMLPATREKLHQGINDFQQSLEMANDFATLKAQIKFQITHLQQILNEPGEEPEPDDKRNSAIALNKSRDGLSGLPNRESFNERLTHEFHRWRRYDRPLTMAIIAVDNFQQHTSDHGSEAADKILKVIGSSIAKRLREVDFFGHLESERFVAIMPETTLEKSVHLLQKLRTSIARAAFNYRGESISATLSISATDFKKGDKPESAFVRADEVLASAERDSVNRLYTL